MLQRILRVEGVGRLRRLCWPSIGHLGPAVGLYAENGTGKSTLVAVLRAARDGSTLPLFERRTLGGEIEQRVELLVGGKQRRFEKGEWQGPFPPMDLFDMHFVETHVYVGRDIGPEQRQQLYRLAIGEAEVELTHQVEAANGRIATATESARDLRRVLEARAATVQLPIEEFVGLAGPPAEAVASLAEKSAQLSALDSAGDLATLMLPNSLPSSPPLNLGGLRSLLDESARSVSEVAARKVRDHLRELGSSSEAWLLRGVQFAEGKSSCPFCAQSLDGSGLARAMVEFFDKAYEDLKAKIVRGRSRIAEWTAWGRTVAEILIANEKASMAWARFLALSPSPPTARVLSQAELVAKLLEELLDQKSNALMEPLGGDERVRRLEQMVSELSSAIEPYSEWVAGVRSRCVELLGDRQATHARLRQEVQQLKAQLVRADDASNLAIERFRQAEKELEQAKADRASKQASLEALGDKRAKDFTKEINRILSDFGAGFTVEGLVAKTSQAKVNSDFAIAMSNGAKVKASSKKANEPRVDTVLSEGDRRTLALAIFLSSVSRCPDIQDRVVVLDDPFTSLDRNRRHLTCSYIQALMERCAQVVVLSHDEFFLRDALPPSATELELRNVGDGAEFVTWSAREACLDRHTLEAERLRRVADGEMPAGELAKYDVQGAVRVVLEAYLKTKYPSMIRPTEYLGTFLERAMQAEAPPLDASEISRLRLWTGYSATAHHGNPVSSPPRPTGAELRSIARQVLEFIA